MPHLDKDYPEVTLEAYSKTWAEKRAEKNVPNFRLHQHEMVRGETRKISGTMTPAQRRKANTGTVVMVKGKGHKVEIAGRMVRVPGTRALGKKERPMALSAYDRTRAVAVHSAKANMSARQADKARRRIAEHNAKTAHAHPLQPMKTTG